MLGSITVAAHYLEVGRVIVISQPTVEPVSCAILATNRPSVNIAVVVNVVQFHELRHCFWTADTFEPAVMFDRCFAKTLLLPPTNYLVSLTMDSTTLTPFASWFITTHTNAGSYFVSIPLRLFGTTFIAVGSTRRCWVTTNRAQP